MSHVFHPVDGQRVLIAVAIIHAQCKIVVVWRQSRYRQLRRGREILDRDPLGWCEIDFPLVLWVKWTG